jgi:hypothetical protein
MSENQTTTQPVVPSAGQMTPARLTYSLRERLPARLLARPPEPEMGPTVRPDVGRTETASRGAAEIGRARSGQTRSGRPAASANSAGHRAVTPVSMARVRPDRADVSPDSVISRGDPPRHTDLNQADTQGRRRREPAADSANAYVRNVDRRVGSPESSDPNQLARMPQPHPDLTQSRPAPPMAAAESASRAVAHSATRDAGSPAVPSRTASWAPPDLPATPGYVRNADKRIGSPDSNVHNQLARATQHHSDLTRSRPASPTFARAATHSATQETLAPP